MKIPKIRLTPYERQKIKKGIREVYFLSEERKKVIKRAETAVPSLKKDGTPKMRLGVPMMDRSYTCEKCGKSGLKNKQKTKTKKAVTEWQIDHVSPVGGMPGSRGVPDWMTWDIHITRTLVPAKDMQLLCVVCHKEKTILDKERMRSGEFYDELKELYEII